MWSYESLSIPWWWQIPSIYWMKYIQRLFWPRASPARKCLGFSLSSSRVRVKRDKKDAIDGDYLVVEIKPKGSSKLSWRKRVFFGMRLWKVVVWSNTAFFANKASMWSHSSSDRKWIQRISTATWFVHQRLTKGGKPLPPAEEASRWRAPTFCVAVWSMLVTGHLVQWSTLFLIELY